jgi:hypothetical protein
VKERAAAFALRFASIVLSQNGSMMSRRPSVINRTIVFASIPSARRSGLSIKRATLLPIVKSFFSVLWPYADALTLSTAGTNLLSRPGRLNNV